MRSHEEDLVPFVPPSVVSDDSEPSQEPPRNTALEEMRRREMAAQRDYQWQAAERAQQQRRLEEELAYQQQRGFGQASRSVEEITADGQPRVPFVPPSVVSGDDDDEEEERETSRENPRLREERVRQARERSMERARERAQERAQIIERERRRDQERVRREEEEEREARRHNDRVQREQGPNWEQEGGQQQFMRERLREEAQNKLFELKAYRWRPSREGWKHVPAYKKDDRPDKPTPTFVRIITWNVDFQAKSPYDRMTAALRHIRKVVLRLKDSSVSPPPCCILLQEVRYSVIATVLADEWVRRHFNITPLSIEKWPGDAQYGNMTLVAKSLTIVRAQILHFAPGTYTMLHRTGVAVSIKLRASEPRSREAVICIVNTHLESLPAGEPLRPKQMSLLTRFLNEEGVDGGIIAGDMNAIGRADRNLPASMGLRDSWKRGDHDEEGFTWGYQAPSNGANRFPPGRLDKVLYLPGGGYKVEEPRRIGVGVKDEHETEWVSDHYGLETTLRMIR